VFPAIREVYYSAYFYWSFGHYEVDNAGAYQKTAEDAELIEENTVIRIAKMYEQQGASSELVFLDWIKSQNIAEYKTNCGTSTTPKLNWFLK
jgi:imidazole glycerol phosphate synthase subunit HisF